MRALLHDPLPNLRQGARVALASVLAFGLASAASLPYPYIAVVSAVIVIQTYVADTLRMALYRVSGTIIGCLLSLAALWLLPPGGAYAALGLFAAIFLCAFLISWTSHFRMAAITVAIVYVAGLSETAHTAFALERTLEIVIGVVCALLVSVGFFPERAARDVRASLAEFFQQAARDLDVLTELFLDMQRPARPGMLAGLDARLAGCRELLAKAVRTEAWFFSDDKEGLAREALVAERVHEALHGIAHALAAPCGEGVHFILEPELRVLGRELCATLRARAAGADDECAASAKRLRAALDVAEERLAELRALDTTKRLELAKVAQFYAAYQALHGLAESLLEQADAPGLSGR